MEERRDQARSHFMVSVTDAVNSLMMQSVGMSLHLESYDKFNERFLLRETIGSPYAVAAAAAFSHVAGVARTPSNQ